MRKHALVGYAVAVFISFILITVLNSVQYGNGAHFSFPAQAQIDRTFGGAGLSYAGANHFNVTEGSAVRGV